MPSRLIWVAELLVSDMTAAKIQARHNLDPADIVTAIQCRRALHGRRVRDDRGTRLLVPVRINGQLVLAVLYPAGDDVWHLASAYRIGQGA